MNMHKQLDINFILVFPFYRIVFCSSKLFIMGTVIYLYFAL